MQRKILYTVILLFYFSFLSAGASDKEVVCCYYDISAVSHLKDSGGRVNLIAEQLKKEDVSIAVLSGIKDRSELDIIKDTMPDFTFAGMVEAEDQDNHIAIISKIAPEKYEALNNIKYNIGKGVMVPVRRGFLHAVFNLNGYRLHIFGANLKRRIKDPDYSQYDMRRYEAREIRKIITALIKKEKNPNILLLAGLNDTCGKSPVKDIYNRRFGIEKRLFDLRPVDSLNVSWTALDKQHDEYERIDYAIISSGLIPEVITDQTMIIEESAWQQVSVHRPLIVTIACSDAPLWGKDKISEFFPYAIRARQ